jgi:hypothetical protein
MGNFALSALAAPAHSRPPFDDMPLAEVRRGEAPTIIATVMRMPDMQAAK